MQIIFTILIVEKKQITSKFFSRYNEFCFFIYRKNRNQDFWINYEVNFLKHEVLITCRDKAELHNLLQCRYSDTAKCLC